MSTSTGSVTDTVRAPAGFIGSLADTPLAEVLRRIVREERSGDLQVTTPDAIKTVYFDRGFIVFASSNREGRSSGRKPDRGGPHLPSGVRRREHAHEEDEAEVRAGAGPIGHRFRGRAGTPRRGAGESHRALAFLGEAWNVLLRRASHRHSHRADGEPFRLPDSHGGNPADDEQEARSRGPPRALDRGPRRRPTSFHLRRPEADPGGERSREVGDGRSVSLTHRRAHRGQRRRIASCLLRSRLRRYPRIHELRHRSPPPSPGPGRDGNVRSVRDPAEGRCARRAAASSSSRISATSKSAGAGVG